MITIIAGIHLILPAMGKGSHPGSFGIFNIEPERAISLFRHIGLPPYRFAVGQLNCTGIVESSHTLKGSIAMIERTIFLHQDHNMLGIKKSAAQVRIDGKCFLNGGR